MARRRKHDFVTHRLPRDCGVCAVANLRGWTWEQAAAVIFPNHFRTKKKQWSTYTADVRHLAGYGRLLRAYKWDDIPDGVLVRVRFPATNKHGYCLHWVVWKDGMVWDSELNSPMRPLFYTAQRPDARLMSYIARIV